MAKRVADRAMQVRDGDGEEEPGVLSAEEGVSKDFPIVSLLALL